MKATSTAIVDNGGQALNQGELIWYLGLRLLMATCSRWSKADFWDEKPYNPRSNLCPYQFSLLMNKTRFNEITSELRFTNRAPPTYRDRFWEVREMVREWNKNMWAFFIPSWMIYLDESMSIWFQRWTCCGWVFCPCKPHPLVMNTIQHVVDCRVSCFPWRRSRGMIVFVSLALQSLTSKDAKHAVYCCV